MLNQTRFMIMLCFQMVENVINLDKFKLVHVFHVIHCKKKQFSLEKLHKSVLSRG